MQITPAQLSIYSAILCAFELVQLARHFVLKQNICDITRLFGPCPLTEHDMKTYLLIISLLAFVRTVFACRPCSLSGIMAIAHIVEVPVMTYLTLRNTLPMILKEPSALTGQTVGDAIVLVGIWGNGVLFALFCDDVRAGRARSSSPSLARASPSPARDATSKSKKAKRASPPTASVTSEESPPRPPPKKRQSSAKKK